LSIQSFKQALEYHHLVFNILCMTEFLASVTVQDLRSYVKT